MPAANFVTVLFVTADDRSSFRDRALLFLEHVAHPSDYSYSEIHAEIIVRNTGYAAVDQGERSCILRYTFSNSVMDQPFVECVRVPVTDLDLAHSTVECFSKTNAVYRIPYTEFLTPTYFLRDLDLDPTHWGRLYCSQFVLLCLKKFRQLGIIPLPGERLAHLDDCPTETCSPAHLRHMLDRLLGVDEVVEPNTGRGPALCAA